MDPKLAGCNASVERMFTRLLAYAGNAETRGFLPENVHILVGIPRGKDAVSELVRRKVLHALDEGGFEFVSWSHWQESGDKLVEQRAKDRDRKRRKRAEKADLSADTSADVHPHRREEKRREESSGYVERESRVSNAPAIEPPTAATPPEPRCPQHLDNPTTAACRPCGDARRARQAWDADQERARKLAISEAAHQSALARSLAIADCGMCDDEGYLGTILCDHDPETPERTQRGIAECRAAIGKARIA
ncbi:hypothetical protein LCL87_24935 [Rhodococcus hoagii]|nr:hypothetical protein [Prescottella equi]